MMVERLERLLEKTKLIPEDNVTDNAGEYETPNAFDVKIDDLEESLMNLITPTNVIHEISYNDFKKDNTKSLKHKINDNIKYLNKQMRIAEQLIDHATKLKIESNTDRAIFFKSTYNRFSKISERMRRLEFKLREFNK